MHVNACYVLVALDHGVRACDKVLGLLAILPKSTQHWRAWSARRGPPVALPRRPAIAGPCSEDMRPQGRVGLPRCSFALCWPGATSASGLDRGRGLAVTAASGTPYLEALAKVFVKLQDACHVTTPAMQKQGSRSIGAHCDRPNQPASKLARQCIAGACALTRKHAALTRTCSNSSALTKLSPADHGTSICTRPSQAGALEL